MNADSEDLAQFVARSCDTAFGRIVERHGALVHGVACRMTPNRELAREITQSVFIHLARKARSIRGEHLAGWLHKTTRWEVKNAVRKEARGHRLNQQYQQHMDARSEDTSPAPWNLVAPWLDEAVSKLSAADQEIVILRFFQRLSFAEISRSTGKTEEACKKRAQRCLERLRNLLRKRGVQPSLPALSAMIGLHAMTPAPGTAAELTRIATSTAATSSTLASIFSATITLMSTKQLASIATVIAAIAAVSVIHYSNGKSDTPRPAAAPPPAAHAASKPASPKKSFDWNRLAHGVEAPSRADLDALSAEELAAALEEVTTMDGLSKQKRAALRGMIVGILAGRDPMLVLNRLAQDEERDMWFDLLPAFQALVAKDFKTADAWFHQQLGKGLLADNRENLQFERNCFEWPLLMALNRSDPSAAFQRILQRENGPDRADLLLGTNARGFPGALEQAVEHHLKTGDAGLFTDVIDHSSLVGLYSPGIAQPEDVPTQKEIQRVVESMPDEAARDHALKRIEEAMKTEVETVPLDLLQQ